MEQKRDLIAFRKAVDHAEAAIHELLDGVDHHIPKTHIEGRFKIANFLGQAGKIPPIQSCHQIQIRQYALIHRLFIGPHLFIQFIKFHGSFHLSTVIV